MHLLDDACTELVFDDGQDAEFYPWSEKIDGIIEHNQSANIWEMDDNICLGPSKDTDYEKMLIDVPYRSQDDPIYGPRWRVSPHNSDIDIDTDEIPLELVRKAAGIEYQKQKMDIADAFQVVLDLARQNVVDSRSCNEPDVEAEARKQMDACDMVEDYVVNHMGDD